MGDHGIETAERCHGLFHQSRWRGRIGQIANQGHTPGPVLRRFFYQRGQFAGMR